MAAATSAQEARSIEFATDLSALVHADYTNTSFTQWFDGYVDYVKNGLPPSGQHPPNRPPG